MPHRHIAIRSFALLIACVFPAIAFASDAALVEAAKREGRVVWYTAQIIDQVVRPLVAAFEEKYGVKVDYSRTPTTETVLRVVNEARAGRVEADMVDGTSASAPLKRQNLLLQWHPDNQLASQFVDPQGYWIATNLFVLTPAINTTLVPKEMEPRNLEDLLNPIWRNKIAWSIPPASGVAPEFVGLVLKEMGHEKGLAFLHALAEQNLTGMAVSSRQVLDQVIAGDFPMALQIFNSDAGYSAAHGAPNKWLPLNPALALMSVISITRSAPHPNAAKLLIEFMVSKEGQEIMVLGGQNPTHPDVSPTDESQRPDGVKFRAVYLTPEENDEQLPKWAETFNEIFR